MSSCYHSWGDYPFRFSKRLFAKKVVKERLQKLGKDTRRKSRPSIRNSILKKIENLRYWHTRSLGKRRMLVLCHGRNHPKLLPSLRKEYSLLYVDKNKKCRPDVVMNIRRDIDLFIPFGKFDAIAFVFPPYDLFLSEQLRENIKQLLAPSGNLYFAKTNSSYGIRNVCQNCGKATGQYDIFAKEVKEHLFPTCNVICQKITR